MSQPEYLKYLSQLFENNKNESNAFHMKKYMRDKFDFFGIKAPRRKEIYIEFKQKNGLIPSTEKEEIIRWCWTANEREYQMFGMEFLGRSAKKENEGIIELYEYMILTKSWWDTVDYIASNLVGTYFQRFPDRISLKTNKWMDSGNIWLQRTCLLFQLKYKHDLNTELLEIFISQLSNSKEFFIQKAIGWILREYSKTDPHYVLSYIKKNKLSGLSKREGLLYLKNHGII